MKLSEMKVKTKPIHLTPPKTTFIETSNIDDPFLWLANNSSFQMLMLEWVRKVVPGFEDIKTRGKQAVLKEGFSKRIETIKANNEIVKRMDPELLAELKEVLAKRKAKIESK